MDRIRSWLGLGNTASTSNSEIIKCEKNPAILQMKRRDGDVEATTVKELNFNCPPDPKVVEFFKLFPEPYKTKAIDRFSSREGLNRWDFFRDMAMKREFESAKKGVFLEDKREWAKRILEPEIQEEPAPQETEDVTIREPSALEKAIRSKIPVHPDESLGLKLFQTVNFIALGVCVMWLGVSSKKRKPTMSTGHYYMTVVGASYCFIYCQAGAAYRLMDWGPFDRTEDNRDAVTKIGDEFVKFVSSAAAKTFEGKDES